MAWTTNKGGVFATKADAEATLTDLFDDVFEVVEPTPLLSTRVEHLPAVAARLSVSPDMVELAQPNVVDHVKRDLLRELERHGVTEEQMRHVTITRLDDLAGVTFTATVPAMDRVVPDAT